MKQFSSRTHTCVPTSQIMSVPLLSPEAHMFPLWLMRTAVVSNLCWSNTAHYRGSSALRTTTTLLTQ